MGELIGGPRTMSGSRDAEGHRSYKVKYQVKVPLSDGPASVFETPGLPLVGSTWQVGTDYDAWAYCLPTCIVTPRLHDDDGPNRYYDIEHTFSTKPPSDKQQRCQDTKIEDPLLEPPKVSGSFTKHEIEGTHDRFGQPIRTSSHEQIRGKENQWDSSRATVKIEMNVPQLEFWLLAAFQDKVNDVELWGMPRRCVKLTHVSWERVYKGSCDIYYKRHLEFEARAESFDRDLVDEGSKCISGRWNKDTGKYDRLKVGPTALNPDGNGDLILGEPLNPDPSNPNHFIRFKDKNGENIRGLLNGKGEPVELGGGIGAEAEAFIDEFTGEVSSIQVIQGGVGYMSAPNVTIIDETGSGEGATATATVVKGVVTAISVNSGGQAYLTDPTVTIGAGGDEPGKIHVEYYREANFLFLGIPLVL